WNAPVCPTVPPPWMTLSRSVAEVTVLPPGTEARGNSSTARSSLTGLRLANRRKLDVSTEDWPKTVLRTLPSSAGEIRSALACPPRPGSRAKAATAPRSHFFIKAPQSRNCGPPAAEPPPAGGPEVGPVSPPVGRGAREKRGSGLGGCVRGLGRLRGHRYRARAHHPLGPSGTTPPSAAAAWPLHFPAAWAWQSVPAAG